MRVGIDARFLTHPQPGGFKTYVENLVRALATLQGPHTFVLYLDRSPADMALTQCGWFEYRVVEGTFPVIGMPVREQLGLVRRLAQDQIDVVHFPCLTAALACRQPFVLTMHDTIWLSTRPGALSTKEGRSLKRRVMWLYNRWIPKWAAERAQQIVTISSAAKADIVNQLGIAPDKIAVIHVAAKEIFRPQRDPALLEQVRRRYGLAPDYIMGIGSADPRKNIIGLVAAYAQLPAAQRAQHQLAIVWTHSFLQSELLDRISGLGIGEQVRFLEHVSDQDLALLYNGALLFVFPSHYEGFGLPPLEAMACGTPVVAADNSSLPEVTGDAALLVDSRDFSAIAQAMRRMLEDTQLRQEMADRGLQRARMFSWQQSAQETVRVYESTWGGVGER